MQDLGRAVLWSPGVLCALLWFVQAESPLMCDESVLLTRPHPNAKDTSKLGKGALVLVCHAGTDLFLLGRMGEDTISSCIRKAFESIGVKDITGHGARGFFCTRGFNVGVPDVLTTKATAHRQVSSPS